MLVQSLRKKMSSKIPNFINGEMRESKTDKHFTMLDPSNGKGTGMVPVSTEEEFNEAVKYSEEAFLSWREIPILMRQRYLFKLHAEITKREEEFCRHITREHGKTHVDARGDLMRGLEVLEHACGMANLTMGETQMGVSKGVDTYTYKVPLGVCAGVAPFNFPAMIPLWMFPVALACGNTFILKPSERTPSAALLMAECAANIDLPKGVLQMVNGDFGIAQHMCRHPKVKAVSFVGANHAGMQIAEECAKHNKRYQSNMAAKNHCIIMPDCEPTDTMNNLINAAFGSSGQRCMALAVAVFVGDTQHMLHSIVEQAQKLKVGSGYDSTTDVPPVCYKAQKERIQQLVESVQREGGKVLLDGTQYVHSDPALVDGNYLGPTVIEVDETMTAYQEEIFGPVLCVVRKKDLESAIEFVNNNKWGNAASIFTKSGSVARKFQTYIEAGQVGVNVPIPIPQPMFAFTGNKQSFNGSINFLGKSAPLFYTQHKTITTRWRLDQDEVAKINMAFPLSNKS